MVASAAFAVILLLRSLGTDVDVTSLAELNRLSSNSAKTRVPESIKLSIHAVGPVRKSFGGFFVVRVTFGVA
jgi:hypothetical protein